MNGKGQGIFCDGFVTKMVLGCLRKDFGLLQASEINKRYKNMMRKLADTKNGKIKKSQRSVDS